VPVIYTRDEQLKINEKLDALAESQGKLLAGINELSGQIKGLGDGLVDEIRLLGQVIKEDEARGWGSGYTAGRKSLALKAPRKKRGKR